MADKLQLLMMRMLQTAIFMGQQAPVQYSDAIHQSTQVPMSLLCTMKTRFTKSIPAECQAREYMLQSPSARQPAHVTMGTEVATLMTGKW